MKCSLLLQPSSIPLQAPPLPPPPPQYPLTPSPPQYHANQQQKKRRPTQEELECNKKRRTIISSSPDQTAYNPCLPAPHNQFNDVFRKGRILISY